MSNWLVSKSTSCQENLYTIFILKHRITCVQQSLCLVRIEPSIVFPFRVMLVVVTKHTVAHVAVSLQLYSFFPLQVHIHFKIQTF